jgi:hypothetical protein
MKTSVYTYSTAAAIRLGSRYNGGYFRTWDMSMFDSLKACRELYGRWLRRERLASGAVVVVYDGFRLTLEPV